MILKILLLIAVIALVYVIFFKKKEPVATPPKEKLKSEDMVACESCGTYTSASDTLMQSGKYYCSRECMEA